MEWIYLPTISSIYDDKVSEVTEYFKFLKLLTQPHSYILYREPALLYQTKQLNKIYNEEKYNLTSIDTSMLRSSAVLVIYNFIESISCILMQDIHNHILECFNKHKNRNDSWTLNRLNPSLREKIIDYANTKGDIKSCIKKYLSSESTSLDTQIILEWLKCTNEESSSKNNQGKLFHKWFSGNVDVREIKKMISPYGIDCDLLNNITKKTKRAHKILEIKNGRNNLAHGSQTFAEYGSSRTIEDLETDFQCIQDYFNSLLDIVNDHLNRCRYLENSNQ
jgi:hypothetical protein